MPRPLDGLAFDGGDVPLVGTLFIKLPGGSAKHAYRHAHAPRVRAPYRLYCSPPEHCHGIAASRRVAGAGPTEVVPLSYDDLSHSLAVELNVSVDTLHRAAQRSVAPQHCPSKEIVVLWLAKLLIMKLTIAAHPERHRFAWVDAGFNVYRVRNMDPPPAPWTSFWPAAHSVAIARHPGACHNELRSTNYSACPIATFLYGDKEEPRVAPFIRMGSATTFPAVVLVSMDGAFPPQTVEGGAEVTVQKLTSMLETGEQMTKANLKVPEKKDEL